MTPLISIPRDALAELLRASGSSLTPEQYVASLPDVGVYEKYASRAWAAGVSKYLLLVVAVLGVVSLPFLGFDFENLIIVVGLVTVTFFEYRVHRYFREGNLAAPSLGFRNQSAFAGAILIYCLYHAIVPSSIPMQSALRQVMDPDISGLLQTLERVTYLFVGFVAGGSQFGLAWYYLNAQIQSKE